MQSPPTMNRGSAAHSDASPALLAKAALRRLAIARLEPTPENYARAYADDLGGGKAPVMPPRTREVLERVVGRLAENKAERDAFVQAIDESRWDDAQRCGDRIVDASVVQAHGWAQMINRLARSLERGSRQWTQARKKESLQRVLESSGNDLQRMQHRLVQLIASWDQLADDSAPVVAAAAVADATTIIEPMVVTVAPVMPVASAALVATPAAASDARDWQPMLRSLEGTVRVALTGDDEAAVKLADELGALAGRIGQEGATPALALQVEDSCARSRRWLAHRHHLLDELSALCKELSAGMTELSEDDSWARGQCENLSARLADGLNARSVRAASDLLAKTREKQRGLRTERERARDALKGVIRGLLDQLGEIDQHTDRFETSLSHYADVIEQADSIDGLSDAVREMIQQSRAVQERVGGARRKLLDEQAQAAALEGRVRQLESELRQLSDEVSTDALTQVANRRGLSQAFEIEKARLDRTEGQLAVGLIDIDNFKKLNDTLGHAAGDDALKSLAARVRDSLRPIDTVARYGGEEFVVMLPDTPVEQATVALTRLQRTVSTALFMHENREMLVTFSAGVTTYRPGETLESTLQRADEALYEAKRTGKNRTCIG